MLCFLCFIVIYINLVFYVNYRFKCLEDIGKLCFLFWFQQGFLVIEKKIGDNYIFFYYYCQLNKKILLQICWIFVVRNRLNDDFMGFRKFIVN